MHNAHQPDAPYVDPIDDPQPAPPRQPSRVLQVSEIPSANEESTSTPTPTLDYPKHGSPQAFEEAPFNESSFSNPMYPAVQRGAKESPKTFVEAPFTESSFLNPVYPAQQQVPAQQQGPAQQAPYSLASPSPTPLSAPLLRPGPSPEENWQHAAQAARASNPNPEVPCACILITRTRITRTLKKQTHTILFAQNILNLFTMSCAMTGQLF